MRPDDFVSVVLPTFNRAETIRRAAESVLNQTHADLEVIVVDDGSSDRTEAVLAALKDPRLKYIKLDHNRGQSAARNAGMRAATGNLVAFQDSDDEWLPDKLARQLEALTSDPDAGGVYCDLLRVFKSGQTTLISAPEPRRGRLIDRSRVCYATFGIGIQSCVLRKAALASVAGFREDMHCWEDMEFLLRISRRWALRRLPATLVRYHENVGVSQNGSAERHARALLLRRYGARIALSSPGFIFHELSAIRALDHALRRNA